MEGAPDQSSLMSAAAVRERCGQIYAAARDGRLTHFALHEERLDVAADRVITVTRRAYPDLSVPFHARWRHFVVDGEDRWSTLADSHGFDRGERVRVAIDLAVTSVLLDAGAGAAWRYRDPRSGDCFVRSEGLAVASLEAFANGLFSSDPNRPCRADAGKLAVTSEDALANAFQVTSDNPLEGLSGRTLLMQTLGRVLQARPDLFGVDEPRIGNLFDYIVGVHPDGLSAPDLLAIVLAAFGDIWPGRIVLDGRNLGDTWRHPAAAGADETDGLVPFHKLSQWLTYSLIEPLREAGMTLTDIDGLTGLAEYRNGGLFVDTGVLVPRNADVLGRAFAPGDEVIVEWRALTVVLLDKVAGRVRQMLGLTQDDLPLASVLEGGTWAAGREIAKELRPGGLPPINIAGDGSVF